MLIAELNRTRKIGAEFEMTVPLVGTGSGADVQHTLANVLTSNGVRAISRPYTHASVPARADVCVEYDGSVQGESRYTGIQWFPVEIKTRVMNGVEEWEQIVPKTLEICRYMGARVNVSCGHHLHLAFPEFKEKPRVVRSLWNLVHRFDPVVFALLAPSRRHSNYCRPMPPATKVLHGANSLRTIRRVLSTYDRYCGLNLTHLFADEPRIELRHHHGTLNATTARHWLRFCLQLVQHAVTRNCQAAPAPLSNDRQSLERLLVTVGLKVNSKVYAKVDPELRETGKYMLRRWKHFQGDISLREIKKSKSSLVGDEEANACAE